MKFVITRNESNPLKIGSKTILSLVLLLMLLGNTHMSLGAEDYVVVPPKIEKRPAFSEMKYFESQVGKVVVVTKRIYGGDRSLTIRGKVRNISQKPISDIFVIWHPYKNNELIRNGSTYEKTEYDPMFFGDKIYYLAANAEADFEITLNLYSGIGSTTADSIRDAVANGREYIAVYLLK